MVACGLEVIFSVPGAPQCTGLDGISDFPIQNYSRREQSLNPRDTCIESWSSANIFEVLCRTYQWLAFPFLLTSKIVSTSSIQSSLFYSNSESTCRTEISDTSLGLHGPQNWNILEVFSCGVEILQESAHRLCLSHLGDAEPTS